MHRILYLCTKARLKMGLINLCDLWGKIIFHPVKKTLEHAQSNTLAGTSTDTILYAQGQFAARIDVPLGRCWETLLVVLAEGVRCAVRYWVRAGGAANHLMVHRTAPTTKKHLTQHVNTTGAEKLCSRAILSSRNSMWATSSVHIRKLKSSNSNIQREKKWGINLMIYCI